MTACLKSTFIRTLYRKRTKPIRAVVLLLSLYLSWPAFAINTASSLFEEAQNLVYQIRVIDLASGDKYSIGSGFQISEEGHVATNFHVVSSFVHEPEKYRLEYVHNDGTIKPLHLLDTDVVHDLALAIISEPGKQYLPLAESELAKGDRIYSMGNPHDLGMTIIEGTYNGLVENSRYRKILFSGSLNAGMSGGPALNPQGEVMGINVSKGGEQLSFLVPVNHLIVLLENNVAMLPQPDHASKITAALLTDQKQFYEAMLARDPGEKTLAQLNIIDKLDDSLKCWGHSVDEDDVKYTAAHQHCRTEDQIFVSEDLYVGDFSYNFEFIETEHLNRFQFYRFLEERFTHKNFSNTNEEDQVTEFRCSADLVELNAHTWKISSCLRAYKKYEGLYDASMAMISMDFPNKAAVVTVGASGVSDENAIAIFRHIAGAVTWTP